MIFVILGTVFTIMNWIFYKSGKHYQVFMGLALACISLGMCGEYHSVALWVNQQDWSALEDVVPSIERVLWLSVSSFSFLNVLPAFLDSWNNRTPKAGKPKKGQRLDS